MRVLNIGEPTGGEIVLHFSGEESEVDAISLGEVIVHISNIIYSVNRKVSPDSEIKIVVTNFEIGSFRVIIKFIKNYTKRNAEKISVNVISGLIIAAICALAGYTIVWTTPTNENNKIKIEEQQKRVIAPRDLKRFMDILGSEKSINEEIYEIAKIVHLQHFITDLSIFLSSKDSDAILILSKSLCEKIIEEHRSQMKTQSDSYKITEMIEICSAVFDKPENKWKFDLNGVKISASILDQKFLKLVRSGNISISAGKRLYAKIKVTETKYVISGDIKNKEYKIKRVLSLPD